MSLFKKIVVTTLVVASVSIGIGAYIIYEKGYSLNDLNNDFEKIVDGDNLELELGNLKSLSFEERYSISGKDKVTLETKLGDVKVVAYEGDEVILTIKGEVAEKYQKDYLQVKETPEGINIKLFDRIRNLSFFRRNSNNLVITLKIPVDYKKNLELTTVSGQIEVTDTNLDILTITSISGEVDLQGGSQKEVVFSMVSGDLSADSTAGYIKGETVSGDVTLKKTKGFNVSTISGDLSVYLYDEPIKGQGETVSGDLYIEIVGSKEVSYDFETVSGDITIETLGRVQSLGKSAKYMGLNENIVKGSSVSGDLTLKN